MQSHVRQPVHRLGSLARSGPTATTGSVTSVPLLTLGYRWRRSAPGSRHERMRRAEDRSSARLVKTLLAFGFAVTVATLALLWITASARSYLFG
jgi:hypothetical protein